MKTLLFALASLLLVGCESAAPYSAAPYSPAPVAAAPESHRGGSQSLFQYAGSRQCSGGGKSIDAARRELSSAGIEVLSAQCGHDGRLYASQCGNPDGAILVVKVPSPAAGRARGMGWKSLEELPEATTRACR